MSPPCALYRQILFAPEYVGKKTPNEGNDSNMYTPEEVERVRAAGKVAAGAIVEAAKIAVPGTTTDQIDVLIHEYICDHGAYPSTLGLPRLPEIGMHITE